MRPSPRRILIALAVLALAAAPGGRSTSQERKPAAPVRLFGQAPAEFAARRDAVRTAAGSALVLISGEMFTGRDSVHAYLMKNPPPADLRGSVLYHCGPVMLKQGDELGPAFLKPLLARGDAPAIEQD